MESQKGFCSIVCDPQNRSEITLYHFVMYNLISKLVDI